MSGGYDYGSAGIAGIATPQANPTVEAEMRVLLDPRVLPVTVRLTSRAASPEERLRAYLLDIEDTLERFDTLKPDALGFACTGSSYLVDRDLARRTLEDAENRFGYPIVTAAAAIKSALADLGAQRIALLSPYPGTLARHAQEYWQEAGFAVEAVRQVAISGADTRAIYRLSSSDARLALEDLRGLQVDAVVLSGTGMPSLSLLAEAEKIEGPKVLSSNICLAERLTRLMPAPPIPDRGWHERLAAATGRTSSQP